MPPRRSSRKPSNRRMSAEPSPSTRLLSGPSGHEPRIYCPFLSATASDTSPPRSRTRTKRRVDGPNLGSVWEEFGIGLGRILVEYVALTLVEVGCLPSTGFGLRRM